MEDTLVFVCDMERCLRALAPSDRQLLALCVFEDRSEWEAARALLRSQADVSRRLGEVLDLLHETFCRTGLLTPLQEELLSEELDALEGASAISERIRK